MLPSDPSMQRPNHLFSLSREDSRRTPTADSSRGEESSGTVILPSCSADSRAAEPQTFRPPRTLPPLTSATLSQTRLWQRRQTQQSSTPSSGPSTLYESIIARKLPRPQDHPSDPHHHSQQQLPQLFNWATPPLHDSSSRVRDPRLPPPSSLLSSLRNGHNHITGNKALASGDEANRMTGDYSAAPDPSEPRTISGMAVADLLSDVGPTRGEDADTQRETGGQGDRLRRRRSVDEEEGRTTWRGAQQASGSVRPKRTFTDSSRDSMPEHDAFEGKRYDRQEATQHSNPAETATEGLAYQYAPVQQITEGRQNIEYILRIREQPKHSRMCGVGEKADRRPIDPAPIVQLRVVTHPHPVSTTTSGSASLSSQGDLKLSASQSSALTPLRRGEPVVTEEGEGWEDKAWYLENPCYFMCAMLADAEKDEELHLLADGKTRYTTGSCVSCLYHLKDIDGSHQGFFVFPDLSIRVEGRYRLKLCLFETIGTQVHHCKSIYSSVFMVYTAKRFPGMEESTQLSRSFAGQGLKVRVRKNARGKRQSRTGGRGSGGSDKFQDEASDDDKDYHTSMVGSSESDSKRLRSNSWLSATSSNEYVPPRDPRHKGSATSSTRVSGSTDPQSSRGHNPLGGFIPPDTNRNRAWTTGVLNRDHPSYASHSLAASEEAKRQRHYLSQLGQMEGVEGEHPPPHTSAYPRQEMHLTGLPLQSPHMLPPPGGMPSSQQSFVPGIVEGQARYAVYQHQHLAPYPSRVASHGRQRSISSAASISMQTASYEHGGPPVLSHYQAQQQYMGSHTPLGRPSALNPPTSAPAHSGYPSDERWQTPADRESHPHSMEALPSREAPTGSGSPGMHGPPYPLHRYPVPSFPSAHYTQSQSQPKLASQAPHHGSRPPTADGPPSQFSHPYAPQQHLDPSSQMARERSLSTSRRFFTPPATATGAPGDYHPQHQPDFGRPRSSAGVAGVAGSGSTLSGPSREGVTILPPLARLTSSSHGPLQGRDRAGTVPSSFHSSSSTSSSASASTAAAASHTHSHLHAHDQRPLSRGGGGGESERQRTTGGGGLIQRPSSSSSAMMDQPHPAYGMFGVQSHLEAHRRRGMS